MSPASATHLPVYQPQTPFHMVWLATNACNARCVHCSSDALRCRPAELTTEEARKMLSDLREMGVLDLAVSGGEPLLRKDLFELIAYATQIGLRVGLGRHRMMLRPRDSHDLRLHDARLDIDPAPSVERWAHDVFGNSLCLIEWPETVRTELLRIVSCLDLTHFPACPDLPVPTLDPAAEIVPFSYAAHEVPDLARLTERHLPDPERTVDKWARRFVAGEGEVRTLRMLEAMTHAIKADFTYEARYEEGTRTPAETLRLGSGTCRDVCRALGIACFSGDIKDGFDACDEASYAGLGTFDFIMAPAPGTSMPISAATEAMPKYAMRIFMENLLAVGRARASAWPASADIDCR